MPTSRGFFRIARLISGIFDPADEHPVVGQTLGLNQGVESQGGQSRSDVAPGCEISIWVRSVERRQWRRDSTLRTGQLGRFNCRVL